MSPTRRVIAMLALAGVAPRPALPQAAASVNYTIAVDVNLVVLNVTVRDSKGGFVSSLQEQDFQVYEDGRPQDITLFRHEDEPVTAGMVIDNSGSMSPKRNSVIAAGLAFIRSSNMKDEMFVVNFNEHVRMGLPPAVLFTGKVDELRVALGSMSTNGRTALYDAVETGLQHLAKGTRDKRVLIVVSDGGDNASRHTLPEVMNTAEQSSAMIYTIGLFDEYDHDRNPRLLRRLARATGGETYVPDTVDKVVGICERIARDIRNQYTVGYVPTNRERNGAYRTIRVSITPPDHQKLSVRTRAGYRLSLQ